MKFANKTLILGLSLLSIGTVLTPAVSVFAAEKASNIESATVVNTNVLTDSERMFLKSLGLTDVEIDTVNNQSKTNVELFNGNLVNNDSGMQQRGKWSTAAKLLLKNYNKLPGWVKAVVGYGAANSIAKTLETYSGNLEDGVTLALEMLGFSGGLARYYAKAITWVMV